MRRALFPHPHGCKDDGKVLSAVVHDVFGLLNQTGLATNLGRNLELGIKRKRNMLRIYQEAGGHSRFVQGKFLESLSWKSESVLMFWVKIMKEINISILGKFLHL